MSELGECLEKREKEEDDDKGGKGGKIRWGRERVTWQIVIG